MMGVVILISPYIKTKGRVGKYMVRPSNLQEHQFTGLRQTIAEFIENKRFSHFITFVILINAVTLGLETDGRMLEHYGRLLTIIDSIALVIFLIEICLKLYAYGPSFFRAGWNVFDFIIVTIALLPAIGPLSVLRTLRVLRVLRLVSVVPQMRRVIAALFHAIPGMASIIAVLLIIFCIHISTRFYQQFCRLDCIVISGNK